MVIEWYPTPGCILSTSSVTGIECLERYAWLEWAEGIGGFWVSEGRRRAWEREALCANGQ